MKLKHNAGSKTDREKLAKSLVWALQSGSGNLGAPGGITESISHNNLNAINLPPGIIEKTAKQIGIDLS